jgi:tetrahydromethanopterin S-methyltransferase subunit G
MKTVKHLSRTVFSKNNDQQFANSLTHIKEADQIAEAINKRLDEIQKKLKPKNC